MIETWIDGNLSSELQWLLVFSAKATILLLFSVAVVFVLRKWAPAAANTDGSTRATRQGRTMHQPIENSGKQRRQYWSSPGRPIRRD